MALPSCTICLEEFDESKEVSVLDCGHAYHYPCILDWALKSEGSGRCPACKKKINWHPAVGVVLKVFFHQGDEKGKYAKRVQELEKQLADQKHQTLKGAYCTYRILRNIIIAPFLFVIVNNKELKEKSEVFRKINTKKQ